MYTYAKLIDDINYLKKCGVEVSTIGKSELGQDIPYIHIGDYSKKQIIVIGAIHARENITALLVMKQAYELALEPSDFDGDVYFIPMLNPDGAILIEGNWDNFNTEKIDRAIEINNGSLDFSLWKANINGVDLNNNFDARFGQGRGQVHYPAPQGYMGEFAFCQKETENLMHFSLKVQPSLTISYHAKGREIYWEFSQKGERRNRDAKIARAAAKHLGYLRVDGDLGSSGGYKDWCIDTLKIPALTIEIIDDKHQHPLTNDLLDEDWEVNRGLIKRLKALI
ncbi:MAG: hypothetical protein FWE03_03530 [Firmicutes bacterium]|nr:hypothetical protein [Bacillota bacterium]